MRDIVSNISNNEKPTYKDYQSFLQNYNGTRSNAATISPASSNSSLQSSENDVGGPKTYNEFLQSYGTRKFGSVRMKKSGSGSATNGTDEVDTNVNANNNKKVIRSELVINIQPPEERRNHQESYQKLTSVPSPKIALSPRAVDNSTVSDEMIYAKTAVLEELLTNSLTLKKSPAKYKTTPRSIYQQLEQFTNKEKPIPPPLPTSKPPLFRRNSSSGPQKSPISPKPPVPQKTFLKFDDLKRSNSSNKEQPTITTLNIPPPPKFPQQPTPGMLNHQNNISITTTVVPVSDPNVDVDKSDPNVKKLVYNTYRGMLGAYNGKANNMVSTLPRNFVVQDRGVSKQLESITSQGCLANLNGRVNPNPED